MNFLLLFTCLCVTHAQPDVIGSDKPVTVTVGDDVILPCHLGPPFNVRTLTVEWTRDGQYVHVWRHGKDYLTDQDENFRGRTSLFHEEMIRGNISLKLTSVTELDAGSYTCIVPKLQSQVKKNFIILTVEPGKVKDPGESDVIGSDKPVTVTVGDNVILPFHLEPPFDVRSLTVVWTCDGQYVHVYRSRMDDPGSQDKNFRGRTSVFHEEMIRGNISLKLTRVTELDAGSYTCSVPKLQSQVRRGFINLIVEPEGGHSGNISGGTGLSPGAITGIAIGVIAVLAIVVFLVRKNRRKIRQEKENIFQHRRTAEAIPLE
ncbi:myelin-oligodendrocyte glycoprotein isoform X10 [Dicentrarchus labrax]|uniref:myelin-oligodendrocyte glycoprotein isoform X10 n=1 Tax=Dicentrarchus labrax TaxID=13489 RepID=UPI0021F51A60|nr:myelin-oligodendrocyte glycoprotein isoform X10 [Dicentrarchus labrax]XP_051251029.1 myelin-oligodendrocyte glycoprotein isoform X10 [Dicentrarchus labrax]